MFAIIGSKDGSNLIPNGLYQMNTDESGWLKAISDASIIVFNTQFSRYQYNGVNYLVGHGSMTGPGSAYNGYYLSVNRNGYLGLYSWSGASSFWVDGNFMYSKYNGQRVGITSDGWWKADNSLPPTYINRDGNADLYAALGA